MNIIYNSEEATDAGNSAADYDNATDFNTSSVEYSTPNDGAPFCFLDLAVCARGDVIGSHACLA
jgi:hypothetical protein